MRELSKLGKAALAYVRKGWAVFPCEARGKKPLTEHGLKDASTDPREIRAWWTTWPNANIGHPTGQQIVLDVDGPQGKSALAALERQHGTLPQTLTARTGKGEHFYFSPNRTRIRNSTGKLGDHLDVRAVGGYTILPPSVHNNSKRYAWTTRTKPARVPDWLVRLLAEPTTPRPNESAGSQKIHQGRRNAQLTSLAGTMRRRGMSKSAIEAGLIKQNKETCDPPLDVSEVKRIAASVGSYQPATHASEVTVALAKMRVFSEINPEPVRWLWPGRVPVGKLTLIAGDPGLGKSLVTVDIAAHVSTAMHFPDGAACQQGSVIFLSAEDGAEDTIRPRLDAAGADVSRVHLFEAVRTITSEGKSVESGFNLERDVEALQDAIRQTEASLVVIDPISAYLGGTDSHTNADVRGLLAPLAALAAKNGTAIIAVTHLRKSAGAAIHRTMGSLAFAAAARAVWGVVADPEEQARRMLLPVKQNLAPDSGGLAYRIEAPHGIARIAWEPGAIAVDINALMSGLESREDHSERREAEDWLKDFLADGPRGAAEVKNQSKLIGLTWITVRRAADSIRVIKRKIGGRGAGWEWALPGEAKDAQTRPPEMSTFEQLTENMSDNRQYKVKDAHLSTSEHVCQASAAVEPPNKVLPARARAECEPLVQGLLKRFDCRIVDVEDLRAKEKIQ